MANPAELVEFLEELKDSIQKQGTLLESFISRLDAARVGPEDGQQSAGASPDGDPGNEADVVEEHVDAIAEKGQQASRTSPDSNAPEKHESTMADKRSLLLNSFCPLLKEYVVFYRATKFSSRNLSLAADLPPSALGKTIEAVAPQPRSGVASKWKYWVPVYLAHDRALFYGRGGRPDYVPPWELREVAGKLFHVDDTRNQQALEFTDTNGAIDDSPFVPYSFSSPSVLRTSETVFAKTGITVDWDYLHSCLGTLYSVPPDQRIPLPFEKNELRLKSAPTDNTIRLYLEQTRQIFEDLENTGGSFHVMDYDLFDSFHIYSWDAKNPPYLKDEPTYWKAAGPALLAESESCLTIRLSMMHLRPTVARHQLSRLWDKDLRQMVIRQLNSWRFGNSLSRSWYRVIECRGLATIMGNASVHEAEKKWSALVSTPEHMEYSEIIREAFDMHIFCHRVQGAGNPHLTRLKPFHIRWFQIIEKDSRRERCLKTSSWKSGLLYGCTEKRVIQESCFTLTFIPHSPYRYSMFHFENKKSDDVKLVLSEGMDFSTILLLTPFETVRKPGVELNGATYVLRLIMEGLREAADAWGVIRAHLSLILDDTDTMLDPRKHDELLFDDDTFSRSRLYFWATDSLELFITQIKDTIGEWENFWAGWEHMICTFDEVHWQRYTEARPQGRGEPHVAKPYEPSIKHLKAVQEQISRLRDYQAQFETLLAKTEALRGALFNASSVIESRASTRLGENVKLLTYVSIFYLPLAFVASLWSIDKDYGTTAFAVTTVLVAIGTYVMVANLENLIRTIRSVYHAVKHPIVGRMGRDPDESWAARGHRFDSFQPRRTKVKPSEWKIAAFQGLEILRWLRIVKDPGQDREKPLGQEGGSSEELPRGSQSAGSEEV